MLITHDLGVVADIADRVVVMYAGRIVEEGTLDEIFYDPQHPYTWGLLGSITAPRPATSRAAAGDRGPCRRRSRDCRRAATSARAARTSSTSAPRGPPLEARTPRARATATACLLTVEDKRVAARGQAADRTLPRARA